MYTIISKTIKKRVKPIMLVQRVKTKIKELIEKKGMSIYEVAKKSELTEACIRNWYTKRNYTPSPEAIEKICNTFNITEAELMLREDEELVSVSEEERDLLKGWLLLSDSQKKLVKMQIDAFLDL